MSVEISGRSFLVIGGAGFIGSHVVDQLLARGAAHVRIYDDFSRGTKANLSEATRDPRLEIFEGGADIRDKLALVRAMRGVDGAFHLAALWLLQCQETPRTAFDVNVEGTMHVAEAAMEARVKRLVFSSSASVYGDAMFEPMPESHPFACQEFYGASKVCGEMLLRAMGARADGFSWVGLRYMNVYGPRQDDKGAYVGVVTRMLRELEEGRDAVVHGDGSQSYDFVDVRDCARANICAMESQSNNACFNVGTGVKTSIAQLATRIVEASGCGARVRFEGNAERIFVRNRVGDPQLARAEIDFGSQICLDEGIRNLVQFRRGLRREQGQEVIS